MKRKIVVAVLGLSALVMLTGHAEAVSGPKLDAGKFALEKGVFNTIFAKELCSCHFVDGLTLDECKARDNLPSIAHSLVDISVDPQAKTVSSAYKGRATINAFTQSIGLGTLLTLGGSSTARYDDAHPEFGCVLTKLPTDP